MTLVSALPQWDNLKKLATKGTPPLRDLLSDKSRNESLLLQLENTGIHLDLSRSKITPEILAEFDSLFSAIHLGDKIEAMFRGDKINKTENRAVLHTALRKLDKHSLVVDGLDVHSSVTKVLAEIELFSSKVRSGELRGFSGKKLTNFLCIGIGGSYLGPEFVYEALRSDYRGPSSQVGQVRFLANVDPVDVGRALENLDPESTLVIVISKTFTTAETMLNAATVRDWILHHYKQQQSVDAKKIIDHHFCAVSTALEKTSEFGISTVFGFWDWVGGRFSVCSAVGILPLSLAFGFETCREFLRGANVVDEHFRTEKNFARNLPIMLGLVSVWNSSFLGIRANAILPYAQALVRFVAHIQQVDMESNGKRVDMNGHPVDFSTSQVIMGEPGTNGQHSFYQLLHQGPDVISCDFIGFQKSTNPIMSEPISNHDELMSNFFAQPNALAFGKSDTNGHKEFPGDRPSLSILMPVCDAFHVGALLALYEHRTAVQSFIWNTNAFDQWGVELGKVLAKNLRPILSRETVPKDDDSQNLLLNKYIAK
jgi:glucose-6-phosphate isomerase